MNAPKRYDAQVVLERIAKVATDFAAQAGVGAMETAGGIRIVESDLLVIGPFEDWSGVRAPSRAIRRRKRGHRQNISLYYKPDPNMRQMPDGSFIGHPVTVGELRREIDRHNRQRR